MTFDSVSSPDKQIVLSICNSNSLEEEENCTKYLVQQVLGSLFGYFVNQDPDPFHFTLPDPYKKKNHRKNIILLKLDYFLPKKVL